ncbi:T9SS type A sorting domain-containing protein [Hymenobacter sp. B81]|uniref:T9SS type A sorting domain-containing protein n=1 Tax=Hymenobacter sp. B81 TaxID=3344878 RepID=UPI0037DC5C02
MAHSYNSLLFSALRRVVAPVALGVLGLAAPARAQAPAWQAVQATTQLSGNVSAVSASTVDLTGSVFLVGTFRGTVSFGSHSLTSPGGACFIAKWRPGTGFHWAQRLDVSTVANVSFNGAALYVAGSYAAPTATLGPLTLTSAGGSDGYVARLTDLGSTCSVEWAQSLGGPADDQILTMAHRGQSVFVGGDFASSTLTLGSLSLLNSSPGSTDAFVAKVADAGTAGEPYWAERIGGPGRDYVGALAVDNVRLYVGGGFYGATTTIGSTILTNTSTSPALATSDAFVARLTDGGFSSSGFSWAERIGGPVFEEVSALAVNGSSVYVAGRFNSLTATLGSTNLTNASGSFDTFVAKLTDNTSAAALAWAYRAGGSGHDAPAALAVRGSKLLMAGAFYSATVSFGPHTLTNASPLDTYDIFLTQLEDAGSSAAFTWAQRAGGSGDDDVRSLAVRGSTVYAAGSVMPTAGFGTHSVTTPAGSQVAYLASLTDLTLSTAAPAWAAGLQLYPNPARHAATVQLPAITGATQEEATLTLTDALGRAVRTQQVTLGPAGTRTELALDALPAGLYQLRVQVGAQQVSRALALE